MAIQTQTCEERELEADEACERCGKTAVEIVDDEALCMDCAMDAQEVPDIFYGLKEV